MTAFSWYARILACAAASLPALAAANDFPTLERVLFVEACVRDHPDRPRQEMLYKCSCALDNIAERIRALGHFAPGTYARFVELSSIKEEPGVPNAQEMIRQLVDGQEALIRTVREAFKVADEASDQPSAGMLSDRMEIHEKNAWMLRSFLENGQSA